MTITEIATSLRLVLKNCVNANKDVSIVERRYFASLQNDSSDEEIVSFWLSVSCLEDHQVPMFVVERWAERASTINEWMALLERRCGQRWTGWKNAVSAGADGVKRNPDFFEFV